MRHPFHAICPYFAMFPEQFVQKHLIWSKPGDTVFDPFSGRGTTVFESLLSGRQAAGVDTNSVAVCISNAKANPPDYEDVVKRIDGLQNLSVTSNVDPVERDPFFRACFHHATLKQLLHLRRVLKWRSRRDDCFIAATLLGCLHGESDRSARYLSNRMPRTISTKPAYSVRWWKKNGFVAPARDVYSILKREALTRFEMGPAALRGRIALGDARKSWRLFPKLQDQVKLVITSPPYLDTTNFREDQWLRLWFLGGLPHPDRGHGDDRHTNEDKYWTFLAEAWSGVLPLLRDDAQLVVRIGGKRLSIAKARTGLVDSLQLGLERRVRLVDERTTETDAGQARVFSARGVSRVVEYDFSFTIARHQARKAVAH
jgi:hypothetical protein